MTSIPHSSLGMGMTEKELTVSITEITSGKSRKTSMISLSGFIIPQEVSLCTRVTRSYSPPKDVFEDLPGLCAYPSRPVVHPLLFHNGAGLPQPFVRKRSAHAAEHFFPRKVADRPFHDSPCAGGGKKDGGRRFGIVFCKLGWQD